MSQSSGRHNSKFCYGSKIAMTATSWKNENPERRFLGCENYPNVGHCNFFRWIDPPMCEKAKQIILGLLRRLNEQESNIKVEANVSDELAAENAFLKLELVKLEEKNQCMREKNRNLVRRVYTIIMFAGIGHLIVYFFF